MIERIVVPLDGSLTAERILPHVRRVLYRNDSELILVQAVPPPPVEGALTIAEAQLGAAREYVVGQKERLEQAGVRVKHVVEVGYPASVILDVVKREKATLVAMATHGSSGIKRFVFGSVAEAVIRRSPVPVLLVRPFWSYELTPELPVEQAPIRNVLVPVDGSDLSVASLPGIVEFADLFNSRVVLLRALEGKGKAAPSTEEKAEAEKQLRALAHSIEKKGVETLSLIEQGKPVEKILGAVQKHKIDLVAMTTHGRSGVSRAVTGSVTEQVLRHAMVPLLVTRSQEASRKSRKGKPAKAGANS